MFRRSVRAGASDQRGQSLVEFALVLPVFLLIVTGLFDLARAVWQEETLAYAAREGARYAIVHGSAGNPTAWPGSPPLASCSDAASTPPCHGVFAAVPAPARPVAT